MRPPFEIRDPEISSDALLQTVRGRLDERRRLGQLPPPPPDFGLSPHPELMDQTLDYHLRQAHATYDRICPDLDLAPSPVAHIPVLGWLWSLVRRHLHELILFYLDRLAANQVRHNQHVVGALNRLAALESENALLRQQIAERDQLHSPTPDRRPHDEGPDG